MRVLLHTPLKPPDHPVPSGDREMARGFARLLGRLGHKVDHAGRQSRRPGRPRTRRAPRARAAGAPAGIAPDCALAVVAGASSRAFRSVVHLSLLLPQARLAGADRHQGARHSLCDRRGLARPAACGRRHAARPSRDRTGAGGGRPGDHRQSARRRGRRRRGCGRARARSGCRRSSMSVPISRRARIERRTTCRCCSPSA